MRLPIAGILILTSLGFAGEPKPPVKAAVLAAEQKWYDALIHADGAALEKLTASDLLYTHSSAMTQSRAEFLQAATSGKTKYASVDFSDVAVRQYGSTVIITHKVVLKTMPDGETRLFVTEVWAEQSGAWQMVSRQATKLP